MLAIGFTVAGTAVLAAGDAASGPGSRILLGDAMALAAAAAAAVYLVLGRQARGSGPLPVYLFKVNGVAALVLLLTCLAARTPLLGFSARTWAILAAMAAGPHLAGHGLLNYAVRILPATTVNLALAGEPLLSTVYAMVLLDDYADLLWQCKNADKDEAIVNDGDDAACFSRSSRAVIDLLSGVEAVPGPGPEEMKQASRLLAHICAGGADGKEIPIAG